MCALHMHLRQTDAYRNGSIVLNTPVETLLQSCVDSATTILRILRIIGDEDLLEAFLPFQLEDAFSSAFILYLIRTISPTLIHEPNWSEDVQSILDKMISKGSVVAPLRKAELGQLEHIMSAFTPLGDEPLTPAASGGDGGPMPEQQPDSPGMSMEDAGWDLFMSNGMVGISPGEMLDLAAQLEVDRSGSARGRPR